MPSRPFSWGSYTSWEIVLSPLWIGLMNINFIVLPKLNNEKNKTRAAGMSWPCNLSRRERLKILIITFTITRLLVIKRFASLSYDDGTCVQYWHEENLRKNEWSCVDAVVVGCALISEGKREKIAPRFVWKSLNPIWFVSTATKRQQTRTWQNTDNESVKAKTMTLLS